MNRYYRGGGTTYFPFTSTPCGYEQKCSDYPMKCSTCQRKKKSYYIPDNNDFHVTCNIKPKDYEIIRS